MAKFIIRRLLLMLLTMFIVSIAVFVITEASPGNVAVNVLGNQITPEQEASFLAQNGLDKPLIVRYVAWLAGSDWMASGRIGMPLRLITSAEGFKEWWAEEEDGTKIRWKLEGDDLLAQRLQPDGSTVESVDNERWQVKDPELEIERLTAYRQVLVDDSQIPEAEKQIILQQLDVILQVLQQPDQSQEALSAALAGPENVLQSLQDPEAGLKRDALETAAQEIAKHELLQALEVTQELAHPPQQEYQTSELRSMARKLDKAATKVDDFAPEFAGQLQAAAESLEAGDVDASRQILVDADAQAQLDHMTASFSSFVIGIESGEYDQAVLVLEDLSDPDIVSLDDAQVAVLPGILKKSDKALKDALPELNDALRRAAGSLKEGDLDQARLAFAQSAGFLNEAVQVVAVSEAAKGARVIRTFWGVDVANHAVNWEKGGGQETWTFVMGTGWRATSGGPVEYIPLQKGLLRGDPGVSLRTGRPVSDLLYTRLRNSLVLAGLAFVIIMPVALILGMIAGLNEGKLLDRVFSVGGMMFSVTPEFATGIFLILIFASWLNWVPGATVFGEDAPWTRPDMLILPVLTLALIELGYVLRITRASVVEVMRAPYVRTAFLKGLPYRRVVSKHVVRNALMAPITVIMLHVNWLLGGIVVVEVIFGYPGLGKYLLDAALFKDFNAIQAGAMVLVAVAVGTQLIADIIYTFLNPRIRYS